MSREDIKKEIERLTAAIQRSKSETLRRDYGKRLKKLHKMLLYCKG